MLRSVLRALSRKLRRDPRRTRAPKGSVGLLAIMKNETDVLAEWLEHYRWQGVDKVFLIDNGSTDDPLRILAPHIESGFVEYFSRPLRHSQTRHYHEIFRTARIRSKAEWLVMADLDEFWFSPLGDLRKALATLEPDFDLLYANWIVFGSSGHVEQPPSIREGFVHRHRHLGPHSSTKWICRTSCIGWLLDFNQHKVGGVDSRRVAWDNDTFRLHHYVIQSLDYFKRVKMTRGDVSSTEAESVRNLDYFRRMDASADLLDTSLADLVAKSRSERA